MNLLAQNTFNLKPQGWGNVTSITFSGVVAGLLRIILVVASVIFFLMLVVGGVEWIMSGGDKAKTEAARGRITAALVGLLIVFSAWAIASLVNAFFGIDIFNLTIEGISSSN